MQFPDDESEFQAQWSSLGGSVAATGAAIVEVEKRSAEFYIRGCDEVAGALRDLATELKRRHREVSERLDGFIKESQRRDHERRAPLRH